MQRPPRPRSRYRCTQQWRRRAERYPERMRCRNTTTGTSATGSTSVYRRARTTERQAGADSREPLRSTALRATRPAQRSRTPAQSDLPAPQLTPGASPALLALSREAERGPQQSAFGNTRSHAIYDARSLKLLARWENQLGSTSAYRVRIERDASLEVAFFLLTRQLASRSLVS